MQCDNRRRNKHYKSLRVKFETLSHCKNYKIVVSSVGYTKRMYIKHMHGCIMQYRVEGMRT